MNRLKPRNYIDISVDTEKAFVKIQHPFIIKFQETVGIWETKFITIRPIHI